MTLFQFVMGFGLFALFGGVILSKMAWLLADTKKKYKEIT